MCNMIAVLYFATQRWLLRYKFMCQIKNKYSVLYASACQITVIFWEKEMDLTKHIFSLTCMYTQSLTLLIANTCKQTHTCYYISTYWFTHIVVCVCVCNRLFMDTKAIDKIWTYYLSWKLVIQALKWGWKMGNY